MKMDRNNVRDYLDNIVNEAISESVAQDSMLGAILMSKSNRQKRSLILGGMMRLANQDDFMQNAEFRARRQHRPC